MHLLDSEYVHLYRPNLRYHPMNNSREVKNHDLEMKWLTLTLSNRCLLKLSSSSIFGGKSGVKNFGKVKVSLFKRPRCVSIWPPNVVLRRDRGVISSDSALASGYRRYSDESSKIKIITSQTYLKNSWEMQVSVLNLHLFSLVGELGFDSDIIP